MLAKSKNGRLANRNRSRGRNSGISEGRRPPRGLGRLGNPFGPGGFPPRLQMTLVFRNTFTLSSALGAYVSNFWLCNGLAKPDQNTTHQPLYYDQVMALYDHYTVVSSKYSVDCLATGTPMRVYLSIDDDGTPPATWQAGAEQSTAVCALLSHLNTKPTRLTRTWNAGDYFGGDILDNINLQGLAASNPTEISAYMLGAQAADAASNGTIVGQTMIEYEVVFTELVSIAVS